MTASTGAFQTRVKTGSDGTFRFDSLGPGIYRIAATKAGFVDGAYGQTAPRGPVGSLELAGGSHIDQLEIRLWQFAAIEGTVTDSSGDAVVGAAVHVIERTDAGPRLIVRDAGVARTDDRGVYRLGALTPGEFMVAIPAVRTTLPAGLSSPSRSALPGHDVVSRGSVVKELSGLPVAASPDGAVFVSPTVFFHDATDFGDATVVALQSGEVRSGVDLTLRQVPGRTVSGILSGPDGPARFVLATLVPDVASALGFEAGLGSASTTSDGSGLFVLGGVPAGTYILRVTKIPGSSLESPGRQRDRALMFFDFGPTGPPPASSGVRILPPPPDPTLWAAVPVTVADRDLSVTVSLNRASRINGTLVFSGGPQPASDVLAGVSVNIEPANGQSAGTLLSAFARADATFTTYGAPPGHYVVQAAGEVPGWHLESAMYSGADRVAVPFELGEQDLYGFVVTFSRAPLGSLNGRVTSSAGPSEGARVLLFPEDPGAWTNLAPDTGRFLSCRSGRNGAYAFTNVPPGHYLAVALPDSFALAWRDPNVLQSLRALALPVRIGTGDDLTIDLRLASGSGVGRQY